MQVNKKHVSAKRGDWQVRATKVGEAERGSRACTAASGRVPWRRSVDGVFPGDVLRYVALRAEWTETAKTPPKTESESF